MKVEGTHSFFINQSTFDLFLKQLFIRSVGHFCYFGIIFDAEGRLPAERGNFWQTITTVSSPPLMMSSRDVQDVRKAFFKARKRESPGTQVPEVEIAAVAAFAAAIAAARSLVSGTEAAGSLPAAGGVLAVEGVLEAGGVVPADASADEPAGSSR